MQYTTALLPQGVLTPSSKGGHRACQTSCLCVTSCPPTNKMANWLVRGTLSNRKHKGHSISLFGWPVYNVLTDYTDGWDAWLGWVRDKYAHACVCVCVRVCVHVCACVCLCMHELLACDVLTLLCDIWCYFEQLSLSVSLTVSLSLSLPFSCSLDVAFKGPVNLKMRSNLPPLANNGATNMGGILTKA